MNFTKYLTLTALLLFGIMVLFHPPTDPDFGWHYKYGEYMVQTKQFLRQNIFSYTNTDYKWANSYWLFDTGVFLLYSSFGTIFSGILLSTTISLLILKFITKHTNDLVTTSGVFIITSVLLMAFNVSIRPFMVSTILLLFFLDILLYKEKWTHYLPLLFLLWVNAHADFVIALFILGVKTAHDIILAKKVKLLHFLPITCFGVTIINPNGIQLWITLFKELSSPFKNTVAEWGFIPKNQNEFLYFFIALTVLVTVAAFAQFWQHKKPLWYVVCVLFFLAFSFKSVYFIRIFYLMGMFAVIPALDWFIVRLKQDIVHSSLKVVSLVLLIVTVLSAYPKFEKNFFLSRSTQAWATEFGYPYDAINFIKTTKLSGNIFNTYDWGGFLIWQLPKYELPSEAGSSKSLSYKTFIDGRMASWRESDGKYFMDEYVYIVKQTKNGGWKLFEEYAARYNIKTILFRKESDFAKYIKQEQGENWKLAYEDAISSVFIAR